MKKFTLLLALVVITLPSTIAQDRMTESDIIGSWKMIIQMDEVMEELEEEADDSESILAKVLLESVSGIVKGVMNNVEIYVNFNRDGEATIRVEAFDEADGDEDTEWYVKNNRLYIEDNDSFDSDGDNYWVLDDGLLILKDEDNNKDDKNVLVYMVRVDN